jgi:hypothetical protein
MPFSFPDRDLSSEFGEVELATGISAARTTEFRTASLSRDVFVDVGTTSIFSKIERNGVPIGPLQIDPSVLDDLIVDKPVLQVKVVRQSIAPGTPVPVGATVNVVLARTGDLTLGVVTGVHEALKDRTISTVFSEVVPGNQVINGIVSRSITDQLTPADTQAVREIFADKFPDVEITDEPGRDLTAAIETLKVIKTFGG